MLGVQRESTPEILPMVPRQSALKDACSRMDLTALHEYLVKLHYKDDGGESEVCHNLVLNTVLPHMFHCSLLLGIFFSRAIFSTDTLCFVENVLMPMV